MSASDDWSSVPARDGDPATASAAGREARGASAPSAAGRVHGRPAPQYGEYAPEGWVNPVLVEQERRDRERAAREAAAAGRAGTEPAGRADAGPRGAASRPGAGAPASRLGASPADFLLTVMLLVFGLISVVQSLDVGGVASGFAQEIESRYTALSDPGALVTAATVSAVGGAVVLALVVWWSVVRLRRHKRTVWVPLLGGAVASVFTAVVFAVAVAQDGQFMAWMMQHGGL